MAILPDPTDRLEGEEKQIFESMLAKRKAEGTGLYGPYIPLMNHVQLAKYIEQLGYYLKFKSTLPRSIYQFIVLFFARRNRIDFEFNDHVKPARDSGLPESIIATLTEDAYSELPDPYSLIVRAMNEIMEFRSVPQDLQDELVSRFGMKGIIEIVVLTGFYSLIGMVNQSFD